MNEEFVEDFTSDGELNTNRHSGRNNGTDLR